MTKAVERTGAAGFALAWILLVGLACDGSEPTAPSPAAEAPSSPSTRSASAPPSEPRFAGSARCASCHPEIQERWQRSDHAHAESAVDPEVLRDAFALADRVEANGVSYRFRSLDEGGFEIESEGADGRVRGFPVVGIFGRRPLWQLLLDVGDGHWQVSQLAFDPRAREWFDVFGDDRREPGDWGHWTGRGMNWNSRCAHCHNTGVELGYDDTKDRFATNVAERGVGCEACHGPASDHIAWRESNPDARDDPADPLSQRGLARQPDRMIDGCLGCHTRRSILDEDFQPGDRYLDHFLPAYPDARPLYYPDGQVRDEDFVGVSFLASAKHRAGLRCNNCHDLHSGDTLKPGDALCRDCHEAMPTHRAHGHHPEGSEGDSCMGCHMPVTTYMARDDRRDHLFSIPDPLLSVELGIPSACGRCHADRSSEALLETFEAWYPDAKLDEARGRARTIARARELDPEAVPSLIGMATGDGGSIARATATRLLGFQPGAPGALEVLQDNARDEDPWVRMAAASALASAKGQGVPGLDPVLGRLMGDEIRAVRVEASRGMRASFDHASPRMADLRRSVVLELPQPTGRAQFGSWLLEHGEAARAIPHLQRSAEWDPRSAEFKRVLGVGWASVGRADLALESLEQAATLDPDDPLLRFELSLAYNEAGRPGDARTQLERVVELAPGFARAWYNLGLALRDQGDLPAALQALARAGALDVHSSAAPYASALILDSLGRREDALAMAHLALGRNPGDRNAAALVAHLEGGAGATSGDESR